MYVWRMLMGFQVFFSHPFLESLLQEFPCENLRYTTSGDFMMRKLAELRSFQAREEVDLDGLLKHFMTPPSQEKKALKRWRFFFKVTKTRFGAKNALLDPLGDATSASQSKHLWVCFRLKEVGCFFLFFLTWLLQALKDKFAIVSLNCSGVRERSEDLRP